jgi:transcriptional antiterminator NusG
MNWYVLHVKTGKETAIKAELKRQGYASTVAPEKILKERKDGKWLYKLKPVFPGYAFIKTELTDEDYYIITAISGVYRFLGVNRPEPLPEHEEEFICWLDNEGLPLQPSPIMFVEGQPARVLSGPLKGHEGTIVRIIKRQHRAILAVTICGQRKEISLSINILGADDDNSDCL